MESSGGGSIINHEGLQRLRQETGAGFQRVLALFLKNFPDRLIALNEAWHKQDRALLRQTAHKLKGTSATFCADSFSHLCAQLESSAEEGSAEGVAEILLRIEKEGEFVRKELQDLLLLALAGE
ncbi:Hpt domain-containing protein [Candidatus Magnetaquicoccus inordinatus]|uniref:Hpt domain-containing protein n=1 Tax=Candidatus Magnetaquicoccus inordinatus TaxID=2496818 RepID=UPI00102C78DC|nr:Hpt domain-containing protein [Candidatus Magnetaquicoccus inordinatus]